MKLSIITYGSRGDVQPFIYLALGLMDKGHTVTLAAPGNFKNLIEGYGVDCYPLAGDSEGIIKAPDFRKVIKSGNNIAFTSLVFKKIRNIQVSILEGVYEASKGADAIICVNTGFVFGATAAEKLKIKWLLVQLNPPMIPTKAFPMPMFNFPDISWLNSHTYTVINSILWQLQKKDYSIFRKHLDMTPVKGSLINKIVKDKVPIIHAFSAGLISRPDDWEDQFVIAGFFNQSKKQGKAPKIPHDLEDWIKTGDKPLYIGFGSIPFPNPAQISEVIKGLLAAGVRIIYCQGWSDMPDVPKNPNLFIAKQIDHAWLLPKCRAAVMHGGIGTVAAVLNAGIPAIITPLFVDQPVWAQVIQQKKMGVNIPWRKLSTLTLLNALNKVQEPLFVKAMQQAHQRLKQEDGIGNAINIIEAYCTPGQ